MARVFSTKCSATFPALTALNLIRNTRSLISPRYCAISKVNEVILPKLNFEIIPAGWKIATPLTAAGKHFFGDQL